MRTTGTAAVLDAGCVLIFVVIGRASHVKGESLAGIAATSWPFLCALAAGWAVSRGWGRMSARRASARGLPARGLPARGLPARGWSARGWSAGPGWALAVLPAGVVIWLTTVALGMLLRVVSGQGTAPSFIVVALVFLGLFLLGWRSAWRLLTAARTRAPSPES